MERPLLPAYMIMYYSEHLQKEISVPVIVPNKVLPMDLYNTLSRAGQSIDSIYHGWITTRGRYVTSEEAAELALEANLLDEKTTKLTIAEYQGSWKR